MTFGLDNYELRTLGIFFLLVPAAFYIMGLWEGKKGEYFFMAGVGFHLLTIAHRWSVLGWFPLAEKHDTISFMALCTALVYLYYQRQGRIKDLPLLALPLVSVFVFVSIGHRTIDTLSPFLQSPWFYLHVFFYFLSYGFFAVSACIGMIYIIQGGRDIELLQHRSAMNGWLLLSLSLFTGSIWFYVAYGTYWLWTSKEMWITITWLFYGLYLHARLMKGFSGRPASAMGVLGLAIALFTYFGVGTVIKSPPTQF